MSHIADLMDRMDSPDDNVMFQAYREAERIADPALVPEAARAMASASKLKGAKRARAFRKLSKIIGSLAGNTGSVEAERLFLKFWRRVDADVQASMIQDATHTNTVGLDALVIAALDYLGIAQYSHAIDYLGRVGQPESIAAIGEALDNDCFGKCDPFYSAFALQTQGSAAGIPYLIRAIQRHQQGRRNWQKELVCYCQTAIDDIRRRNAENLSMDSGVGDAPDQKK